MPENLTDIASFAAANGYSGFRSLFAQIFAPERFDRTFIIKGGPGTGKSTLMKKLIRYATESGYKSEAIYCSSDPSSLDGVIIKHKERAVAILDGTAPHQRDTVYPGACDEIVNLGDGFNLDMLSKQRERIIALSAMKKEAYKEAYSYLSIAGKIHAVASEILSKSVNYREAEIIISQIVDYETSTKSDDISKVYRASFSKMGYSKIEHASPKRRIEISVTYGLFGASTFMSMLYDKLRNDGRVIGIALSPFDDSIIEEIETSDHIYALSSDDSAKPIYSFSKKDASNIRSIKKLHDEALCMAQSAFKEASGFHFDLEDIYKNAIDFTKNDLITEKLKDRITTECEKQ